MKKGYWLLLIAGTATIFVSSLAWTLTQPGGWPAVRERHSEKQRLERELQAVDEQTARVQKEVERLRRRQDERDRAVRKYLNKSLPGETTIILPDAQPQAAGADPAR